MKLIPASGLIALLYLGCTANAWAHAHLSSAIPAQNAVVKVAPDALRLKFTEGLELKFTGVKLLGDGQAAVPTGAATLAAGDDSTLVVPIAGPLKAGAYTVNWHALSQDGHTTQGTYTFSVQP